MIQTILGIKPRQRSFSVRPAVAAVRVDDGKNDKNCIACPFGSLDPTQSIGAASMDEVSTRKRGSPGSSLNSMSGRGLTIFITSLWCRSPLSWRLSYAMLALSPVCPGIPWQSPGVDCRRALLGCVSIGGAQTLRLLPIPSHHRSPSPDCATP